MTDYSAYHWAKKAEEWAQQAAGVTSVNGKTGTVTLDASDVGAQETLVSGTNIKTINNSTILGSGNIDIVTKTFNLLDFKWEDHLLNDQNWLRADTFSWQDGTVYSDAYNHLVDDIDGKTATTETVGSYTISYYLADDGHKITTDETNVANIYNESGVAWYYVLDTTNQRFKLPRENPNREKLIQTVTVTNPSGLVKVNVNDGNGNIVYQDNYLSQLKVYGKDQSMASAAPSNASTQTGYIGLGSTIGENNTGLISKMTSATSVYKGKNYLYFYVGQFSQTATEQTAGLNASLFNGKVDLNAQNISDEGKSLIAGLGMPSSTYETLTLGASGSSYTAPANGYVEFVATSNNSDTCGITMSNDTAGISISTSGESGQYIQCFIPCSIGDSVSVFYRNIKTFGEQQYDRFYFVYAKGSESEAS